jgi:hypothetical protein
MTSAEAGGESAEIQLHLERGIRERKLLSTMCKRVKQQLTTTTGSEAERFAGHLSNLKGRLASNGTTLTDISARRQAIMNVRGFADLDEIRRQFLKELREGDLVTARNLLDRLSKAPLLLAEWMNEIVAEARIADRLDFAFSLFANAEPRALSRFSVVVRTVKMAIDSGRRDAAFALLETVRQRCETHPLRFSPSDRISQFVRWDNEVAEQLSATKYLGITMRNAKDAFRAAEILSDRMDIDPLLLNFLYAHTRERSITRVEWERRLRIASCLGQIFWDQPSSTGARPLRFKALVSEADRQQAFGHIDRSNGVLITTMHSGMSRVNQSVFQTEFKDFLILAKNPLGNDLKDALRINVKDDVGSGLFPALRAMTRGKSVLMAPDGRNGTRNHFGEVLGRSIPTPIGAAFLAYETRCYCGWYTLVPAGDKLIPLVADAPKPEKRESFESYTQRWLSFYWAQLENLLTGDPSRISLLGEFWGTMAAWDK